MIVRAQVVKPFISGLPKDVITNTLHFNGPVDVPFTTVCDTIQGWLKTFYDAISSACNHADYINVAASHINFYNLSEPTPRVPYTKLLNLDDTDVIPVTTPSEVALVLSFAATPAAGINPQSRRGRIYLGGLGNLMSASAGGQPPKANSTVVSTIVNAASGLKNASNTPTSMGTLARTAPWSIYSTRLLSATPVASGWVENEPDTQRRRGTEPGTRVTF